MCTNERMLKSQPQAEIDHRGNKMKEREKKQCFMYDSVILWGFRLSVCVFVYRLHLHSCISVLCLLKCVSCEITFVHLFVSGTLCLHNFKWSWFHYCSKRSSWARDFSCIAVISVFASCFFQQTGPNECLCMCTCLWFPVRCEKITRKWVRIAPEHWWS